MNEVIQIIPKSFRRRGAWVAAAILLRGGLNFLGLAMLLPVLALVLDPQSLQHGGTLKSVYDALGFTTQRSFALAVCGTVVGVIVVKSLLVWWLARVERNYIYDLYRTLSRRLFLTYHARGLLFVKSANSTSLARNVNVVCLAFTAGVLRPAAALTAEVVLLVLLFVALLWYAPVAALLALAVFMPAIGLYYGLVRNRINRYGEQENKAQREKARLVAEVFRGYADIEISGAFPMMLRTFDRTMNEVIRTRLREAAIGQLPQALTEVGLAVGMALLVALSLGRTDGGAQLLFGVFAVAALRLMPSVRNIMSAWSSIKYNRYTIDTLSELTQAPDAEEAAHRWSQTADPARTHDQQNDAPTDALKPHRRPSHATIVENDSTQHQEAFSRESVSRTDAVPSMSDVHPLEQEPISGANNSGVDSGMDSSLQGEEAETPRTDVMPFEKAIEVRDLAFRFPDDGHELFSNLSLVIRKGEKVGISGASGSGKTTLFNLLLGLYEPTYGEICIDGVRLTPANRRGWQNHIGYVSQNLFLIDGSVATNVALGVEADRIDRERVERSIEAAQLGEFVDGLADGIDTRVGESGSRLSGGQRQRLGIARALYRQADVLFFDEATSALDSQTEQEINRSIESLTARHRGLTLIVIAHRKSSLAYCDRIINIERP